MFLLDSLLISGLRWTLDTIRTAADRELHDDAALRERLLDAELRRELGEIDDETFRAIEADVLARLRENRAARGGGSGALAFGPAAGTGPLRVEATLAGDFHEPPPEVSSPRLAPARRGRREPARAQRRQAAAPGARRRSRARR